LGLYFLLLIGFMLLAEAAHLSHTEILGQQVGSIPKGYLYFAITFSLGGGIYQYEAKGETQTIIDSI
jgi:predicted tellurium resistance membrane protein TerC